MKMEKKSWSCTFVTQLSLCLAVYLSLKIGQPKKNPMLDNSTESKPLDVYFISVAGGFRPLQEQKILLEKMEKVVKMYNARFVVDISELGEDDPLMQNATWYFQSLKVPWYTTRALEGQGANYFLKQIRIPHGQTLDIIALDTGSLQDSSSGIINDQLQWLSKTLEASRSNWRIAVGFHPLVACDDKQILEPLRLIFLNNGVNAYMSGRTCGIDNGGSVDKGPHLTTINPKMVLDEHIVNGFLLHRVSSLEIVTYSVTMSGDFVHRIAVQQIGKEIM